MKKEDITILRVEGLIEFIKNNDYSTRYCKRIDDAVIFPPYDEITNSQITIMPMSKYRKEHQALLDIKEKLEKDICRCERLNKDLIDTPLIRILKEYLDIVNKALGVDNNEN